jgi:PST family polysaccharide transporter
MAMLLGPGGFGLFGMYLAIADLARSIAEMGINGSGVRQIAAAVGTGDAARVALTALVLRRVAVALGLLGAVLLALAAAPVATFTFGTEERAAAVAFIGLAVFFRLVADGQGALLQGTRRMADLAKIAVVGPLLGTAASVAIVYLLGKEGIALAIVATAALGLAVSWWYARRVPVARPALRRSEIVHEAGALLRLGVAFMTSGMLMMGAAYAVRAIVLRVEGLEAAGLYHAAWSLGGLYVGIVLQAMGTDFYPRLVGAIADDGESNRLVNEQARVSLLLAGPGVLATLAFAPFALWLLYSPGFAAAAEVLRWTCLGIALRVVAWPMGYIIVARNARALFVATELFWAVLNVGLTLILVRSFGLEGAGVAFFLSYVAHGIVVYAIVRRLTGFRWSSANFATGGVYLGSIAVAAASFLLLPPAAATALATLLLALVTTYAVHVLTTLVAADDLPQPLRRLLARARGGRSDGDWSRLRVGSFPRMSGATRGAPPELPHQGGFGVSSSPSPAGPIAKAAAR